MRPVSGRSRGISPVIGIVLLVAVVLLLSAVTVAMMTGFGTDEEPPSAAFKPEAGKYLTIRHESGDRINSERLRINGGDAWLLPSELRSGTEIAVQPDSGAEEISLVWESEDQSYILQTFDVTERDVSAGPEPMPPQPSNCHHVTSDPGGSIGYPTTCVVVEEGVTLSGSINDATDIYLQPGARVKGTVNPSGDTVLQSDSRVESTVNTGEDLFVGKEATVSGNVDSGGEIVVRSGATLDQQVNSGTELYLLPGATVGGNVDSSVHVYLSDPSQVGGTIHGSFENKYE